MPFCKGGILLWIFVVLESQALRMHFFKILNNRENKSKDSKFSSHQSCSAGCSRLVPIVTVAHVRRVLRETQGKKVTAQCFRCETTYHQSQKRRLVYRIKTHTKLRRSSVIPKSACKICVVMLTSTCKGTIQSNEVCHKTSIIAVISHNLPNADRRARSYVNLD